MTCAPGQCYALPEHRLQPDRRRRVRRHRQVLQRGGRAPHLQAAGHERRQLRPGRHRVAARAGRKPHVRGRGGWVSLTPKPTYYRVAPAAGVNASISDMAQWLIAQTGHRPDVLPAPLLATLHAPVIDTPSELRGSSWRRAAPERRRLRARLARLRLCRPRRRVPWRRGAGLSRRGRDAAGTRPRHRDPLEQRELAAQRPAADDPGQRARPAAGGTGWTTTTREPDHVRHASRNRSGRRWMRRRPRRCRVKRLDRDVASVAPTLASAATRSRRHMPRARMPCVRPRCDACQRVVCASDRGDAQ